MPRLYVNSMSNFLVQGGVVGFTLQDIKVRTAQGEAMTTEPEDVADIVMREQDFAKLLQFFNAHAAAFEKANGRPLGGPKYAEQIASAHPAGDGTGH